jgi:lipopolysaccharide transport system permease protein
MTAPIASPPSARFALRNPELIIHLARRELESAHRFTILGWAWPLARQLVQLVVLVFVFSSVLDLGVANFPAFVFSGLVAWSWFASGVGAASTTLLNQRHLVFQPRLPAAVLPIVAVAVPLIDVVMAFPVLLLVLAVSGSLSWTAIFFPLMLVVQFVLMCGIAWLTAGGSVYLRDLPNIVSLSLTLLFYLTPVFYSLRSVPDNLEWVLKLNPMTTVLEADRALLLGSPFPNIAHLAGVVVFSILLAAIGYRTFQRLEPGFVDEL